MNQKNANAPVKVDIISGFLGAGKTTFINMLLADGLAARNVAVVENELGDTPIDDALLDANGIRVRTLASGCICCSLSADFAASIVDIVQTYAPERIIVEPTGVAGASEIAHICAREVWQVDLEISSIVTIVNAQNLPEMLEMGLEAFEKQIAEARFVLLSHGAELQPGELNRACDALSRLVAPGTVIYRDAWKNADTLEILTMAEEAYAAHPAETSCSISRAGLHDHGQGHGGLSALSLRPQRALSPTEIAGIAHVLESGSAGTVLRAKGFLESSGASPVLYEYVYGSGMAEHCPRYTGDPKMVVIGRALEQRALAVLFGDALVAPTHHHGHR